MQSIFVERGKLPANARRPSGLVSLVHFRERDKLAKTLSV
jgi:hypothetical protein